MGKMDIYQKISETARIIQSYISEHTPEFAIILGSGLSKLQDEVEVISEIKYKNIPNFPKSTVAGHSGKLIYGKIEGRYVLMMAGRAHYYEGYSMQEVTFPIRVFHQLGIKRLIVSNASGGVNPDFAIGDVMIIRDHINMFPEHPLRGKNLEEFGVRFPDMSKPYSHQMIAELERIAAQNQIKVQKGVYLGLQGPSFETPAEYGMVRILGADAVGMSTVPEVIVARHQNMEVCALSVITDLGGPEIAPDVSHEEVLNAANKAMPTVILLVKSLIKNYR
ncbi:purine-nucleoside phosphorylase [Capnocytophaga canimorsus]|uniref:Purine nucleoside phosphorylase n=3 Tax=Capnocytophaga canimorsus TaxID=28188 RepID=F9YU73_CAPCC|nr:Inosine phosphorylase [Capnocytophaga canimorsus Cc5]GIM58005.1 purine nucleoside phosphorylase [Capnocytophaga canimorsus]GJQ03869.1 purine nucleoside phosphorylase [Capnocytophaga canimorsus]CEN41399.1 Purine nucleoside phosphorylase 1 [Capnocytophaga canimorsus]CEN52122.1 Purine nucleoside phosphorylase 1 [Capnocytophaga canimorsus]